MRPFHSYLLGMSLLCSGISGAAHCPTHIINSSSKPWILATAQTQGTVKVTTVHAEVGPLPQGSFAPTAAGFFIMPAHSIVAIEAQQDTTACEAQFMLVDHTGQYPTDGLVTYTAPAASGALQPPAGGSLKFRVPDALQDGISFIVREPSPVILQILRDRWDVWQEPNGPDQAIDAEASR
jgi:hypothetical protein